jgi:hypothetical protein
VRFRELTSIGATWTLIGDVIAIGVGIMVTVANGGAREDIEIQCK